MEPLGDSSRISQRGTDAVSASSTVALSAVIQQAVDDFSKNQITGEIFLLRLSDMARQGWNPLSKNTDGTSVISLLGGYPEIQRKVISMASPRQVLLAMLRGTTEEVKVLVEGEADFPDYSGLIKHNYSSEERRYDSKQSKQKLADNLTNPDSPRSTYQIDLLMRDAIHNRDLELVEALGNKFTKHLSTTISLSDLHLPELAEKGNLPFLRYMVDTFGRSAPAAGREIVLMGKTKTLEPDIEGMQRDVGTAMLTAMENGRCDISDYLGNQFPEHVGPVFAELAKTRDLAKLKDLGETFPEACKKNAAEALVAAAVRTDETAEERVEYIMTRFGPFNNAASLKIVAWAYARRGGDNEIPLFEKRLPQLLSEPICKAEIERRRTMLREADRYWAER